MRNTRTHIAGTAPNGCGALSCRRQTAVRRLRFVLDLDGQRGAFRLGFFLVLAAVATGENQGEESQQGKSDEGLRDAAIGIGGPEQPLCGLGAPWRSARASEPRENQPAQQIAVEAAASTSRASKLWSDGLLTSLRAFILPSCRVRRRHGPGAESYTLALRRISLLSSRKNGPCVVTDMHVQSASRLSSRTLPLGAVAGWETSRQLFGIFPSLRRSSGRTA